MIYVSWPKVAPHDFWTVTHKMNGQIAYHLYNDLQSIYKEEFEWVLWGDMPSNIKSGDFFIRHPSMRDADHLIVEKCCEAGVKIVFFGNTGCDFHKSDLRRCVASIWKSNDIYMKMWAAGEVEQELFKTVRKRGWDFSLIPHPMDSEKFNREVFSSSGKKFLVLGNTNRDNKRKRSAVLRSMLSPEQYRVMTDVKWNVPETYKDIVAECSFAVSYSPHEGFPYFLNESAYKGLLPIGMEQWWHGYGHDEIVLQEGKDKKNIDKLMYVLKENVEHIYKDVMDKHLSREDHTWEYAIEQICKAVRRHS